MTERGWRAIGFHIDGIKAVDSRTTSYHKDDEIIFFNSSHQQALVEKNFRDEFDHKTLNFLRLTKIAKKKDDDARLSFFFFPRNNVV